jgi:hypothetical protein
MTPICVQRASLSTLLGLGDQPKNFLVIDLLLYLGLLETGKLKTQQISKNLITSILDLLDPSGL